MRQLLAEIDSVELAEWQAYYALEPFGELVADQRHGIAVSTLANVNRDPKRRPEPYCASDFIYWHASHRDGESQAQPSAVFHPDPEVQSRLIKQKLFKAE